MVAQGHSVCDFGDTCDVYIINTCSVTAVADKKNRAVIRRCRRENPQAVLAVCGCYPQHAESALAGMGIDVLGGSAKREEFLQQVIQTAQTKMPAKVLDVALKRREFEILPAGGLEGRTRAMLKVQDGCVNFCSYCIIPYTRGPVRSAPVSVAVEQAKALEKQGYKEIVVTGIEIASWGVDLPDKPALVTLLEAICTAVPNLRVRLGSLEPRIVTEEFCKKMQAFPNLCPQFHLSMQSGCDTVLARMKRKYDTARYLESVEQPDLLLVHIPPNFLAHYAAKYKKRHPQVKVVFDIFDLWPETFPGAWIKKLLAPVFSVWAALRDKNLPKGDYVITECEMFRQKLSLPEETSATVWLCAEALTMGTPHPQLREDALVLCYLGSINNIISIPDICDLIKEINPDYKLHIRRHPYIPCWDMNLYCI